MLCAVSGGVTCECPATTVLDAEPVFGPRAVCADDRFPDISGRQGRKDVFRVVGGVEVGCDCDAIVMEAGDGVAPAPYPVRRGTELEGMDQPVLAADEEVLAAVRSREAGNSSSTPLPCADPDFSRW